tara:strand:- start:248 stop:430 length:183 start_codon:yes stop_codon:yes gene_type:complete
MIAIDTFFVIIIIRCAGKASLGLGAASFTISRQSYCTSTLMMYRPSTPRGKSHLEPMKMP